MDTSVILFVGLAAAVLVFVAIKAQEMVDRVVLGTADVIGRRAGPVAAGAFLVIACGLMLWFGF